MSRINTRRSTNIWQYNDSMKSRIINVADKTSQRMYLFEINLSVLVDGTYITRTRSYLRVHSGMYTVMQIYKSGNLRNLWWMQISLRNQWDTLNNRIKRYVKRRNKKYSGIIRATTQIAGAKGGEKFKCRKLFILTDVRPENAFERG